MHRTREFHIARNHIFHCLYISFSFGLMLEDAGFMVESLSLLQFPVNTHWDRGKRVGQILCAIVWSPTRSPLGDDSHHHPCRMINAAPVLSPRCTYCRLLTHTLRFREVLLLPEVIYGWPVLEGTHHSPGSIFSFVPLLFERVGSPGIFDYEPRTEPR